MALTKVIGSGIGTTASLADSNMPSGSVLQVVIADSTTEVSTTSGTYADITGMTAAITPSATSSKILITFSLNIYNGGASSHGDIKLLKGSTQLQEYGYTSFDSSANHISMSTQQHLDSPSSTSALTYKLQFKRASSSGTIYANYDDSNGDPHSQITLMEIAG
tara:strand:+ start:8 stop:496 length:489 start_codon:yes stop_codon:yes gene_type:complete